MRISLGFLLSLPLLFFSITAAQAQGRAPPGIEWHVADRFRLFDRADPDARRRVETLLSAMERSPAPEGSRVLTFYGELLALLSGVNAASLRRSNFAPSPPRELNLSGRYAEDYLYPRHYRIRVTARAAGSATCRWRLAQSAAVSRCDIPAEITVPANEAGTGGGGALLLSIDGGAEYAATRIDLRDEMIVAMGDSYISGEGNPDVPVHFDFLEDQAPQRFVRSDWPARLHRGEPGGPRREYEPAIWWDQPCHRSLLSWPVLAAFAHAARHPQKAVTLVHLGCSGDEVTDGLLQFRRELPGGGREELSQFEMLAKLRDRPPGSRRPVDRLLLSIGGNDVGFAYVIAALILPPNGWRLGALAAGMAGDGGPTACPYQRENPPLSRFCGGREQSRMGPIDRRSSQERLGELPGLLQRLGTALGEADIPRRHVFQITYPNALLDEQGQVCRTALGDQDLVGLRRRLRWTFPIGAIEEWRRGELRREEAYSRYHPRRVGAGFEALLGVIPEDRRGNRTWRFQLRYDPERELSGPSLEGSYCDNEAEPDDSEVCQGLWVWSNLNDRIRDASRAEGWGLIEGHQGPIRGHGWCNTSPGSSLLRFPLAEVRADGSLDWRGRHPNDFDPYAQADGRWFRTTNDAALTQFESPERFHKGTMHPTFRAHVAIAEATLAEAFGQGQNRPPPSNR